MNGIVRKRHLRILTWHVHGSYLSYLARAPHTFLLPVKPGRPEGYGGRCGPFAWPANVVDVPAEAVARETFDLVLFQSRRHYLIDQHELLAPWQRRLPRIYLEHDPPREHPVDQRHVVDDPDVLLVHVTPFNALMWDNGRTPVRVIEHGVAVPPEVRYTGVRPRGLTIVNGLARRGRRAGADLFLAAREAVPLDLVGMEAEAMGGLGEIPHPRLPAFAAPYRFLFNPLRYTSLGLAVCEAMMVGLPVVGLATTEMATVVENGVSGYVETRPEALVAHMRRLLTPQGLEEARALSEGARRRARERFGLARFLAEWDEAFRLVTDTRPAPQAAGVPGGSGR